MTAKPAHSFDFAAPPPDLAPFCNAFYTMRIDAGRLDEMLPAYSGQLLVAPQGRGRIDFGDGYVEAPAESFLIGPLSSARRFVIDGPALAYGVSFNFHGWAAITRLPVATHADRFIVTDAAFGDAAAARLASIARQGSERASTSHADGFAEIAHVLRVALQPLSPAHAQLIDCTYAWLASGMNPEPADLYGAIALSDRQIQRLVKKFFGLPPSQLKRRYRAIRAATLLADPDIASARVEQVIDAFYDQAHMIREIRYFTGQTPRFIAKDDAGLMADTLGKQGYGTSGMFGVDPESEKDR